MSGGGCGENTRVGGLRVRVRQELSVNDKIERGVTRFSTRFLTRFCNKNPLITFRFSFFVSFTCNLTGKMKLENKNSKILRFSSVNFDRFHRKRPLFGTVLPGPALCFRRSPSRARERSCHVIK